MLSWAAFELQLRTADRIDATAASMEGGIAPAAPVLGCANFKQFDIGDREARRIGPSEAGNTSAIGVGHLALLAEVEIPGRCGERCT